MLLVDAVFVNNGGGLVLLKYLLDEISKNNIKAFFLLDERAKPQLLDYSGDSVKFIHGSLFSRHNFYKENIDLFSKVICFGNIPPTIKTDAKVFVYFQQKLYLEIPLGLSFKEKFFLKIKQIILSFLSENTNFWLVQSDYIGRELSEKYLKGNRDKVLNIPFYPEIDFRRNVVERRMGAFIFVSNSAPHKNHLRLIEAFCLAYDQEKRGQLTLTIPSYNRSLCEIVRNKNELGYPIKNVGFIEREKLIELYLSHEYLIFPSLAESLGLGLAEGIDAGCKVIAADLDYTYEVCKPSLVFDPLSVDSIRDSIVVALQNDLPHSRKLIANDITKLIQFLKD